VVRPRLDGNKLHHVLHQEIELYRCALRRFLAHKTADAFDDLSCTGRLFGDLLQSLRQFVAILTSAAFVDAQAGFGVAGDGEQGLIEFVGDFRGHLAHGAQARHMRQFNLAPLGEFFGEAAFENFIAQPLIGGTQGGRALGHSLLELVAGAAQLLFAALALDGITQGTGHGRTVLLTFYQVILRAAAHGLQGERLIMQTAEHDDRQMGRRGLELAQGVETVGIGKREIEQHGIEVGAPGLAQGLRQAHHMDDVKCCRTRLAQPLPHETRVAGIVFDQQDVCHRRPALRSHCCAIYGRSG